MSAEFFEIGDLNGIVRVVNKDIFVDARNRKWPRGSLVLGSEKYPAYYHDIHSLKRALQHMVNGITGQTARLEGIRNGVAAAEAVMSLKGNLYSPEATSGVVKRVESAINEGLKRARSKDKKELLEKGSSIAVCGSKGSVIPQATLQKMAPARSALLDVLQKTGLSAEATKNLLKDLFEYEQRYFQRPLAGLRRLFAQINVLSTKKNSADDRDHALHNLVTVELDKFPFVQPQPYAKWMSGFTARTNERSARAFCAADWMRIHYYCGLDLQSISCYDDVGDDDVMGEYILALVEQEAKVSLSQDEKEWFLLAIDCAETGYADNKNNKETVKNNLKKLMSDIDKKIVDLIGAPTVAA